MNKNIAIVWFRQDLRLNDNLAIQAAIKYSSILPIYVLDDCAEQTFKIGSVTKIILHKSLAALNQTLNNKLSIYKGEADKIIANLSAEYAIKALFFNKCYEPWHLKQEKKILQFCRKNNIFVKIFNSNYLWSPHDILKNDGTYYKVFTAYKNKSKKLIPRRLAAKLPKLALFVDTKSNNKLNSLQLLPCHSWGEEINKKWQCGELYAQKKLKNFIEHKLNNYKKNRDYPKLEQTSILSYSLHFGEISPHQIYYAILKHSSTINTIDLEHFLSELTWREFSCYLMYHFPTLHKDNFNKKFDNFSWNYNHDFFSAWAKGKTGYPLVDAGMRELWQTGYMHNRVRMVAASFLVKNLNIHWEYGRDWFWDCLVDADLANNSASWQWVAGCGVDAAPYFRIFNPIIQGEKFDKNGEYTKNFVPELANMPTKYLFQPWLASPEVLEKANIILGKNYPLPIIDFAISRNNALSLYKKL